MRICLIPLRTEVRNRAANLQELKRRLTEAARAHPDLVCLPECTLTGYVYDEEDFRYFAEPVPGPTTAHMAGLAKELRSYLCFGLVEQAEGGVYDTALLLDREGRIRLTHRKNHEKPPFAPGTSVESAETERGRLGILICGDLFSPAAVEQLNPRPDLLLVPMSRSFAGMSPDPERWLAEERQVYLDAVRKAGCRAVLVNALETGTDEPSFGGALVVSAAGELLAESPHGTDQMLVWDGEKPG